MRVRLTLRGFPMTRCTFVPSAVPRPKVDAYALHAGRRRLGGEDPSAGAGGSARLGGGVLTDHAQRKSLARVSPQIGIGKTAATSLRAKYSFSRRNNTRAVSRPVFNRVAAVVTMKSSSRSYIVAAPMRQPSVLMRGQELSDRPSGVSTKTKLGVFARSCLQ